MSDYGDDDYSDVGDYFYVEDEYTPADDLAEHAVNSPPPTTYADDDGIDDWDRFDYFNDLEYGSDGYEDDEDDKVNTRGSNTAQVGQKRKRDTTGNHGKKRRKVDRKNAAAAPSSPKTLYPPIVWRSQVNREVKPKQLDENAEPYALLKDWRERLADTPIWTAGTPEASSPKKKASRKGKATRVSQPLSPTVQNEDEIEDGDGEDAGDVGIDPTVLMEALQKNLAAAGGPLNGMDPQQLLQFAMRMMSNQDAGDEIAGELADDILMQGEDDEEEEGEGEAPADLMDWLSRQKGSGNAAPSGPDPAGTGLPKSPKVDHTSRTPPTPPSSDANRGHRGKEVKADVGTASHKDNDAPNAAPDTRTRKRKANEGADLTDSGKEPKKRATRSYHAPTAASEAKAVPTTRATKSSRTKR
jgi:hypothetical protein